MASKRERLARRVRKARADTMQRHVLVCTDCDKGSKRAKQLRKAVNGARLRDRVTVTKVDCLDICEAEPIAVVYPEGAWYHSIDKGMVQQIVEEHLAEGRVLDDAAFHVNALLARRAQEDEAPTLALVEDADAQDADAAA